MLDYFPNHLKKLLLNYELTNLSEIRVRANKKLKIIYKGENITLNAIVTLEDIEEIILNACNQSIYSFDEHIRKGFITTDYGERIGLAGEFVFEKDNILTIKNYTSLLIRIPNQVIGFSSKFVNEIYEDGSVLVISKTGVGKTTFIRDLANNLSTKLNKNVTIIDERNEIASKTSKKSRFNLGNNTDVLTYCNKDFGLTQAIRVLNPDVIVTDELISKSDYNGVYKAILSGVDVIATIHCDNISNLLQKNYLKQLIENKLFNYYVIIKIENGKRFLEIYNKNLKYLCKL